MNSTSIIPQSDDRFFSYLLNELLKKEHERKVSQEYILLGLIAVIGTEPFKVLLRKDIGKLSFSFSRLVAACVWYLIWACILYYLYTTETYKNLKLWFFVGSISYVSFSLLVLIFGIKENMHDEFKNQNNLNRGKSLLFGFLRKRNWNETKIWLWAEPSFCFLLTFLITILPIYLSPKLALLGAPLLFTAFSFWFNEGFQIKNVWNVQEKKLWNERQKKFRSEQYRQDEGFTSNPI